MSTLLLRLAAPLQPWGVDAKFDRRVQSAFLQKRSNPVWLPLHWADAAPTAWMTCWLYAGHVWTKRRVAPGLSYGPKQKKSAYVTQRYYLADAVFLAGLGRGSRLIDKNRARITPPGLPAFF